jgi:hypothetical protein
MPILYLVSALLLILNTNSAFSAKIANNFLRFSLHVGGYLNYPRFSLAVFYAKSAKLHEFTSEVRQLLAIPACCRRRIILNSRQQSTKEALS